MHGLSRYTLLLLALLLSACQAPVKEEDVFNVPFSIVTKGPYSQLSLAKELVIRDKTEWRHLWLAHTGNPGKRPPAINFQSEMVMAFFLGQRPTGGYEIQVQKIRTMENHLLVNLRVKRPDPRANTTMALTQTHTIIKLPRYELPVKFIYRHRP